MKGRQKALRSRKAKAVQSCGYSLVEILVVMAIIAIVAALSYPAFTAAKRSALDSDDVSMMRQLQLGAVLYREDEGNDLTSGSAEQMGMPPMDGYHFPYAGTNKYWQPWVAKMVSPFCNPNELKAPFNDCRLQNLAIPSKLDKLPVTWAMCTQVLGEKCVYSWDRYERGRDSTSGMWKADDPYAYKVQKGITLEGSLLVRRGTGQASLGEVWWFPDVQFPSGGNP